MISEHFVSRMQRTTCISFTLRHRELSLTWLIATEHWTGKVVSISLSISKGRTWLLMYLLLWNHWNYLRAQLLLLCMLKLWNKILRVLKILMRNWELIHIRISWQNCHLAKIGLDWLLEIVKYRHRPTEIWSTNHILGQLRHRLLYVLMPSDSLGLLELISTCIIKDLILLKFMILQLWLMITTAMTVLVRNTMAVSIILMIVSKRSWTAILHSMMLGW